MSEVNISSNCPKCGENIITTVDMSTLQSLCNAPDVRSKLKPDSNISVYRISSEAMKVFITEKAKLYVPGVKVEVAPRYCEKKHRKPHEPHRAYASLRIALSQDVIEKNDANGWYGKIGIDNNSVNVTKTVLTNLIHKYSYNMKAIDSWLSSYKTLEELEESFGMTEAYLNDLKEYAIPRRVQTNTNESWVIFSAAAESVISDMLTEVSTNDIPGRIEIKDVIPISKDIIEFIVYLHPLESVNKENPNVRKILMGDEKKK